MSCQRLRSSLKGKDRLGEGARSNAPAHPLYCGDVDRGIQQFTQPDLKVANGNKGLALCGIELDEKINVRGGSTLAACGRTKHAHVEQSRGAQFGRVPARRVENGGALHRGILAQRKPGLNRSRI